MRHSGTRYTADLSPSAPPLLTPAGRAAQLEVVVAHLERQIADLSVALALVRSDLDELRCPAGRDHAHSPAGGCICPVCGLIFASNLRVEYRVRHIRAVHERCPECGGLFVGLRMHWSKAHRTGTPFRDLEEARLVREVNCSRLG